VSPVERAASRGPGFGRTLEPTLVSRTLGSIRTQPDQVVFLTGAGISANSPTDGPVGLELTERALRYAFLPDTLERVRAVYRLLGLDRQAPRLEAVLDVAARVHGVRVLEELLSDLRISTPNSLHLFFRQHLQSGGRHVTANFDKLVDGGDERLGVVHVHGMMPSDPTLLEIERLGARLSTVELGFDPETRNRLLGALCARQRATLVVVGYSGLDFFDVDPFIRESVEELRSHISRVVWVIHKQDVAPSILAPDNDVSAWPPMLRTLARADIECVLVEGATAAFLDTLASTWGFERVVDAGHRAPRWTMPRELDELAKASASRHLFLHMGMLRDHEELLSALPALRDSVDSATLAEIAWQQMDYRAAFAYWRTAFSGTDPVNVSRRLERAAACHWVRGSYFRAYFLAQRAFTMARRSEDEETRALCVEMVARILVHMGRVPDTRWFSTRTRRARVSSQVERHLREHSCGTHTRERLMSALGDLRNDPERDGPSYGPAPGTGIPRGSESFSQHESLSAVVDYERGEKRRAVAEGHEALTLSWLQTHSAKSEALGKKGAVAGLLTLPGAERFFTPNTAVESIRELNVTWWHRHRILAAYKRRLRRAPLEPHESEP
jgi:hypothetical protein